MKKWSLDQLKFASEMCFPDVFKDLLEKHFKGTHWEGTEYPVYYDFMHKYDYDLLQYIISRSRAELQDGLAAILDNIIQDLIGNYGE